MNPFEKVEGVLPCGEVVAWSAKGIKIQHKDLVDVLKDCDLDENVARKLAPRHAFSRACKKLEESRIIRKKSESATIITFQFTAEVNGEDRIDYNFECMLQLDKELGVVTCENVGLAERAQAELDRCIGVRTGSDITRITQRLFEQSKIDLFPIRLQGGCYFVLQKDIEFLERINKFLDRVNASMRRLPVTAGTPHGDRAVRESIKDGMDDAIRDLNKAVEQLDPEVNRESTFVARAEEIKGLRYKLEVYSTYLGELKDGCETALAQASLKLREKIEQLAVA